MFKPYVVFGPEANRKVLVAERDKVLWRNTDPVTDLLRRGVLIVDGDEHDEYRKLMEPPLHPSQSAGYASRFIFHTDRVSAQWRDGEVIDMLIESRKIALLIIIDTLFSKDAWEEKRGKQIHGFRNGRAVWVAIGIHIFLAVAHTTPWDNYLVATGVWYYNPELVTGILLGYVPIEEYMFFVVDTILAGLWWWFLARRFNFASAPPN